MGQLEIRLLGPFQVRLDGQPVTRFRADSVRALLAYLAMHRGLPLRRDALAGLLWPDEPDKVARDNLRQILSLLRTAIGDREATPPYLLISRATIAFNPESDHWLDVHAFSEAMATTQAHSHRQLEACAACAIRLAGAVELYQEDLLAGFSLPSALFEEWVVVEREHLHGQALEALGHLAAYHEAQGEYEEAGRYAQRALALEPWHEAAHCTLMRALALSGQRSAALTQYQACCRALREELGVEPSEETRALYEQIRKGEDLTGLPKPVRSAGPSNLPAQVTPFIGRERELATLGRLLVDPEVRLVTVVGAGGMGKTRLTLQAAQAALAWFPDGAYLVELAPLPAIHGTADGESTVPRAVAAVLGVREQPGRSLPEVIAGALQGRKLLLVLDNCEHVLVGVAPLVALLLTGCPDLAVLATSREPLRVAGEHLYDVPGMEVPSSRDLSGAVTERPSGKPGRPVFTYDALQLFGQRAAAVRPAFTLDEDNGAVVADLCRQLDGMPLAIELAAACLRALSLAELAQRLGDRFRLLTGGSRAALPRQQTLRDTVAWSYDLLSAGERLLFDRLSVFAGSFSLEGAEAVCSGRGIGKEEVLELLARLVDQSLVGRVEGPGGTTRYRLLETLRAYGQERLARRDETERVAARHAGYYVSLVEATEPVLNEWQREMLDARRRLDAEADNLASAIRWALARRQPEMAMRIGGAAGLWTVSRPHCSQYAEWMRQALAQEGEVAPLYRAKAWGLIGSHARDWGRLEEAGTAAQAGLASARAAGDPRWIARGLYWVAAHLQGTGQHKEARTCLQECLPLARQCGDANLAVCTALFLADYEPLGRRRILQEEILRPAPYASRPYGLQFLAWTARAQGDLKGAEAYLRESLAGWAEAGVVNMQGVVSGWLGEIHAIGGDYAGAERMMERGRALVRGGGNYDSVIWATRLLSNPAWRQGAFDTATSLCQEALELARQHGYVEHAALACLGLALVAAERGEHERAEALCAGAQPDLPAWDDEAQALALSTHGRAALLRGDGARAVALYRQAMERTRRGESRSDTVEVLEYLAWALAADGQAGEAARLLALAERERQDMGMVLPPVDRPHHERAVGDASAALGGEGFATAWTDGQARRLESTAGELLAEPEADLPEEVEVPSG
jgi:predicted ATPase/DNA-binding SARP family transcriptional activator